MKELSRRYRTLSQDLTRVMNRLKALYPSWGMACAGTRVYAPRHRAEWWSPIPEAGVRCRAELTYQPLDGLQALRPGVRRDLLAESRKHRATKLLRHIPGIGPGFEWRSFRPPIGFAPSDHGGPTAAWRSRRTAAGNIAMWKVDGDAPRRR